MSYRTASAMISKQPADPTTRRSDGLTNLSS